jgi:hypothetical protein
VRCGDPGYTDELHKAIFFMADLGLVDAGQREKDPIKKEGYNKTRDFIFLTWLAEDVDKAIVKKIINRCRSKKQLMFPELEKEFM